MSGLLKQPRLRTAYTSKATAFRPYIAHAHARTCVHAQQRHARADVHTHMHTQAVECVYQINLLSVSTHTTHAHTRMHIQAHTHKHAHAYVHTHTHVQAVKRFDIHNCVFVSMHSACTHGHTPHAYALCIHTCTHRIGNCTSMLFYCEQTLGCTCIHSHTHLHIHAACARTQRMHAYTHHAHKCS